MRQKSINIIILIVIIIFLLTGCEPKEFKNDTKKSYSFQDSNIVAYVNGEPVDKTKMEQFIDIKIIFYDTILKLGGEPFFRSYPENYEHDLYIVESTMFYKVFYQEAEKYSDYIIKDWKNDYYKTLLVIRDIEKYEFDLDIIEQEIDMVVEKAYDAEIPFDISLDEKSKVDFNEIVNIISKKHRMTYEECVESIFRPFWESMIAEHYHQMIFATHIYEGSRVKYDGTNREEYEEYVNNFCELYEEYVEELLKQAEVIERH